MYKSVFLNTLNFGSRVNGHALKAAAEGLNCLRSTAETQQVFFDIFCERDENTQKLFIFLPTHCNIFYMWFDHQENDWFSEEANLDDVFNVTNRAVLLINQP